MCECFRVAYCNHQRLRRIDNRSLFGGPAQPTPIDERGGIRAASRKAKESASVCSPNQYQNDDVSREPDGLYAPGRVG